MNTLYKLLACFIGIIIFIAIIGTCENNNYQKSKQKEARLNYEMYFSTVAKSCMENSDFRKKLSRPLIEGHIKDCPACNFVIVNEYLNTENWDDTLGELSEYDNIDDMINDYLNFLKNNNIELECNHNDNSAKNVNYLPLHVASGVI